MKEFNLTLVSNNKGFTLLEILIAIALLSFISVGIVTITEDAAKTKERTTEVNANNLQIETAMSRLEWDISQIYSPLYFSTVMNLNQPGAMQAGIDAGAQGGDQQGAFQGGVPGGYASSDQAGFQGGFQGGLQQNPQLQQYFEQLVQRFQNNEHFVAVSKEGMPIPKFYAPEKNVFEFFTSSNRRKIENQKQSHFAWVRYSLADQEAVPDDEENPNIPKSLKSLVRYFSADNPYGDKRIDTEEVKGAVLLRNVEALEFQFWDFQRRKWDTNLKNIQGGESVIRGVKATITWYDSRGEKRIVSRVFRTHWPMVVPQDQTQTGAQAGVQANAQAGAAGNQGGNQTGNPAGGPGGFQGDPFDG